MSAETGIVENGRQDPGRNGLFSIDDGFPGSRRLDGGGCSLGKPVSTPKFPINRENTGKFCDSGAGLASVRAKDPGAAVVSLQIPCGDYQGKITGYQGPKI